MDVVLNHMTSHYTSGVGTAGSAYDGIDQTYPAVSYSSEDFHQPYCEVSDYMNVHEVSYVGIMSWSVACFAGEGLLRGGVE